MERDAQLAAEEDGPVDKDALYEEICKQERPRNRVSKIARMMENEQLKQAREEVTLARA